jgi:hypothetical protein
VYRTDCKIVVLNYEFGCRRSGKMSQMTEDKYGCEKLDYGVER